MYVGVPIGNSQFARLNVIYMDKVFGRDIFSMPVELTVRENFGGIICVSLLDPLSIIETYECLGTLCSGLKNDYVNI